MKLTVLDTVLSTVNWNFKNDISNGHGRRGARCGRVCATPREEMHADFLGASSTLEAAWAGMSFPGD